VLEFGIQDIVLTESVVSAGTNEREKSVVTHVLQESRTEGTGSPASVLHEAKSDMPIRRVTSEREKSAVTHVLQESGTEGTGSPASVLGT